MPGYEFSPNEVQIQKEHENQSECSQCKQLERKELIMWTRSAESEWHFSCSSPAISRCCRNRTGNFSSIRSARKQSTCYKCQNCRLSLHSNNFISFLHLLPSKRGPQLNQIPAGPTSLHYECQQGSLTSDRLQRVRRERKYQRVYFIRSAVRSERELPRSRWEVPDSARVSSTRNSY